jgi:putative Ca2+/H+ antiporter (TMEM165/GDT1 family)
MNLALALSVFGVVFVAELPDKTMIATIIMGSRGSTLAVWTGASMAFVAHMAMAALAGRLVSLLPHTAVEIVVTVLFLAGAAYLLLVSEEEEAEEGRAEAERESPGTFLKVAATAFGVIFIGEFGDLTQIVTMNFAASSHQALTVFGAASLAMISVAALGAFGGQFLQRFLSLTTIRRIGGFVMLALGVGTLIRLVVG